MNPPVEITEKKYFLQKFIKQFQFKRLESKWLLIYLLKHEELLHGTHFVHDASSCPRALTISTIGVKQDGFKFYRNQIVTESVDKAFHDIRLCPFETLYIQLYFPNWRQNHEYAAILEENPFISKESSLTSDDRIYSKQLLEYSIQNHRKAQLQLEIDKALDEKDEDKFKALSKKLSKLR